ncbi:zinc finger protein SHOOT GRAVITROPISM 5-like [Prosopis cineraria]|uniref:zinc finger protein SHOOT GRAVITROPISM 5-like n=1 Tax=Prosopis cineraria TaxID=364024 RepID=UPI00240EC128|nr:zinc finger protein SHOOT GRAVITROPISM 5-like [Prosopis cineraria]
MLANNSLASAPTSDPFPCGDNGTITTNKRKRRPAGTPDPDAEVVSLSPKTLLESDRYVCEICNQGFQRDQNLQMHRRRHKVPWKLLKRETPAARKRVFVCPEPTCLHHDPCHALGDLVGIKKHFRRKHSNHKQWVCERCSKGYAVQSDYKAHLKTCGTRGHSCDCGRVFSRVESFIEHQDNCNMGRLRSETQPPLQQQPPACLSRTASSPSPSSETNFSTGLQNWNGLVLPKPITEPATLLNPTINTVAHRETSLSNNKYNKVCPNLDLRLSTSSSIIPIDTESPKRDDHHETRSNHFRISIGEENESNCFNTRRNSPKESCNSSDKPEGNNGGMIRVIHQEEAREQLRLATAEKAYAEEARKQARRQIEVAEKEFANAKRIRQEAQAELDKAYAIKEHAIKQINSVMLQITCHACKRQFGAQTTSTILPTASAVPPPRDENSLVVSYMSSALTTEGGEEENYNNNNNNNEKKEGKNRKSLSLV